VTVVEVTVVEVTVVKVIVVDANVVELLAVLSGASVSAARTERLYFHLQVAAGRLRADADRRCLEQAGITTAQAAALAVIAERDGINQRELASTLGQAEPSITALVRRLLAAGLVDRATDAADARARRLTLTPDGATALRGASRAFAAINDRIDDALGDDVVTALASALRTLAS
jgi:MarR family transcriptional regulator, organic hydroperoxide resistance regulator